MYLKRLLGMGVICFGLFAASTCFEKNVYAEEFEINEVNITFIVNTEFSKVF